MDIEKSYQEALDYLYSFVDYSLTRAFRYSPEKFDLSRMYTLMERLNNPQSDYPIMHIAGTKGKGSTGAMIASTLMAAGNKIGFYTSPHLQDYNERIQINGIPIPHQDLVELIEVIKPEVEKIKQLTTFEITTALAFLYFSKQKVNAAVFEVGLGGRLDATNVVNPLVSVITSLSLDHMAVLGDTLGQIAAEKGGIIKPNRPVVSSPQKDEAHKVIEKIASERNAPLTYIGRDYLYSAGTHSLDGQTLMIWPAADQDRVTRYLQSDGKEAWQPERLYIPLLGQHQVENAATAYAAIQVARIEGLSITENQIKDGFLNVFWPGRFEILRRNPPFIIDSAHNRDSALRLRLAMDDYLPGMPVILLFGASEDKDIAGMFAELMPRIHQVIATQSVHPRAIQADKLVELAHQFGRPAEAVVPVEAALQRAIELAGEDTAIVAAGSLFIAAAVRECWQKSGQPVRMFDTRQDQ
jgi:dihydrofolate synthase/folylpolyglutamate synthase